MKKMRKLLSILLCLCMLVQNCPVVAFAAGSDNLCDHHTEHTAECGYREGSAGSACTHAHTEECYAILECLHTCGDECAEGCTHECTVENDCVRLELDCHHTHGDCGYSEAAAEVPCGHVHNENCGYAEAVAGNPCANAETDPECDHSGDCGFVAAVEGQPCGHTACDDTCGYAPATEGTPCNHVCEVKVDSDDSCYKLLCSHKDGGHDDVCGYVEAMEAHDCNYKCAECAAALTADETTAPSTEATTEPSTEATEPAPVCDCGTDDPEIHATTCPVYVAPENPQCYCVEKCTALNEWCDVCGFDVTACAGGWDEAEDYATTPTYIASLGIAQDNHESDAKNELSGHTVIDYDLNKGCGASSDYIYMGYKTTTDPSKAITGIFIRTGENPPASATFDGVTAYLVGGSYEANTAVDNVVDLNEDAGGAYIYVYVTRDTSRAPVTEITFSSSNSKSGYTTPNVDLNEGAGSDSDYIYLHYKQYSATVNATYWYLDANGNRQKYVMTKTLRDHTQTVELDKTDFPSYITYNGKTYQTMARFSEDAYWRDDDQAIYEPSGTTSVNLETSGKVMRMVYITDLKHGQYNNGTIYSYYQTALNYDTNGGSGTFAKQEDSKILNAGANGLIEGDVAFTLHSHEPTHSGKCAFLGWSTDKNAATGTYQPGQTIYVKDSTTLYAIYKNHADGSGDGICDSCGTSLDEPALSGGVYQISNKAELVWFMQYVNRGNKGANAKVLNDIDMGGYLWTPIASTGLYYDTTTYADAGYTGTFDGNGKVISNFRMTASTTTEQTYGLFGTISGTVRNLGLSGVTYTFPSGTKDLRAGGVVGQMLPGSTVENCYVRSSTITPGQYIVGGIAACNYGGTLANCYTYQVSVSGHARCGNLVSDTRGDINSADRPGTVTNCYTDAASLAGTQTGNQVSGCEASVSAERFASGEITWLLNGGSSSGVWKQTIGTDDAPRFVGSTVYKVKQCNGTTDTYSNDPTSPQAHNFVNNICTKCGAYVDGMVATLSKNGIVVFAGTTLDAVITEAEKCTASDEAVVTLLKDIPLGNAYQKIDGGVFTIDLNGCEISLDSSSYGTLNISGAATHVTIQDNGTDGKVTGPYAAIEIKEATVKITGGTFSGTSVSGVYTRPGANLEIRGGTFSGQRQAMYAKESTVEIHGGTFRGHYGVIAENSRLTISGGSFSGEFYDIQCLAGTATVTLTLGEDGVGATFPGGIETYYTTLNGMLGEGAAYWAGSTILQVADGVKKITDKGDITVKAKCTHETGEKKNYANNGEDHTCTYSCCNLTFTEGHSYDETTCLCACGAVNPEAVATVSKNGTVVSAHVTLDSAIAAVRSATAADKAVVTLLKNIDLGDNSQTISGGVFTINLNGKNVSGGREAFYQDDFWSEVTIEGEGTLSGTTQGYYLTSGTLTVKGGTFQGCLIANSTATIYGGSFVGEGYGIYSACSKPLTIYGGSFSGKMAVYKSAGALTIYGGSFSGTEYDLLSWGTMVLGLGENGTGATFPGGITIGGDSLNAILAEGAAYWAGETMLQPGDSDDRITDKGDITVKAVCTHENGEKLDYANNGEDHTYTYKCCYVTVTEGHSYGETTGLCACGKVNPDAVASATIGDTVTYHTTLNAAFTAVKDTTEADQATVALLKDIQLTSSCVIDSGVFTLDLAGHTISSTNTVLNVYGGTVTITGGTITTSSASTCGVNVYGGSLTVAGGTIENTGNAALNIDGGNLTVTGGTVTGYHGVNIDGGSLTVTGGTIIAAYTAIADESNEAGAQVTISGGSITVIDQYASAVSVRSAAFTITGGSFNATFADFIKQNGFNGSISLTLAEGKTEGATFPGGITGYPTTLNEIIADGAAYWAGDTMLQPDDSDDKITDKGDITVKAKCTHGSGEKNYVYDGDNHTYTYSCCNLAVTEGHTYDEETGTCACSKWNPEAVATVSKNGVVVSTHTTLDDAIWAVEDTTEEDAAVVTLLKDIDLETTVSVDSGVFTLDLKGRTVTSEGIMLNIGGSADMTVTDSTDSPGSLVSGDGFQAINMYEGSVTIEKGNFRGDTSSIQQSGGTLTIEGGSFRSACNQVLEIINGRLELKGGTLEAGEGCTSWIYVNGTAVVSGAPQFTGYKGWAGHFRLYGSLDLSGMTDPTGLTVFNETGADLEAAAIPLPAGLSFLLDGNAADTLLDGYSYTIGKDEAAPDVSNGRSFRDSDNSASVSFYVNEDGTYYYAVVDQGAEVPAIDTTGAGTACEKGTVTVTLTDLPLSAKDFYVVVKDSTGNVSEPVKVEIPAAELRIELYLKMVDAGGTEIEGILDAKLNGNTWFGTENRNHTQPYTVTIGENTISDWVYGPEGYVLPTETVTFTADEYGKITITSGNAVVETVENKVYIVVTLERDSSYPAVPENGWPIWVAGTVVTADNCADVLGDGTVSYDPETNVLTLENASIETEDFDGIFSEQSLTISVTGENSIQTYESGISFWDAETVILTGTGSLEISSENAEAIYVESDKTNLTLSGSAAITLETNNEEGIYLSADKASLVIEDEVQLTIGTEETPIREEAIYIAADTTGAVTIQDAANVTICTSDEEGIYVGGTDAPNLTISGGTVWVSADEEALQAGTITITGGTITAFGGVGYEGIYADELTISGGSILAGTISGDAGDGVEAGNITITGGSLVVFKGGLTASTTDENGDMIPGTITLGEGMVISEPEGGKLGEIDLSEYEEGVARAVLNSDGTFADALVITDGETKVPETPRFVNVYLGGVGMADGEYLAVGADAVTDTLPTEGGYAYYADGVLTLYNYTYSGEGYAYNNDYAAALYTENALTLVLKGDNSLTCADRAVFVEGALTVSGTGAFSASTTEEGSCAIYTGGKLTITGGEISAICAEGLTESWGFSVGSDMEISGGELTASGAEDGIYVNGNVTISGGTVEVLAGGLWADIFDPDIGSNIPATITLTDVEVVKPEGGTVGVVYDEDYAQNYAAIVRADGSEAEAFIITDGKESEPVYSGWTEIEGDWYYYDPETNEPMKDVAWLTKGEGDAAITGWYVFDDDTGAWLEDIVCIYEADNGDLYYAEYGIAVKNKGLVQVDDPACENGHLYYYFGCGVEGCSADPCKGEYVAQKNNRHWAAITNGYLMECSFDFGADGIIDHISDTTYEGIYAIDGMKFYLLDGVKIAKGLFQDAEGNYYYARSSGALVVGETYWVSGSKLNGLPLKAGNYKFDAEGRIDFSKKNGFYEENGAWYYYEDGALCYKGLYWFDGTAQEGWEAGPTLNDPGYYYINSSAKLIVNCDYWISKNNGYMKNQSYSFDENGTMYEKVVEKKNGFYLEDGNYYYYVDDVKTYAGLIWCDGPEGNDPGYYYVNSSAKLIVNCDYWISKNNGYMKNQSYSFDENGTMYEKIVEKKNGFYLEGGNYYYYVDDVKTYAGLILSDGPNGNAPGYYYVNSSAKLITGCNYWISKNNGYMKNGSYTFDENGLMLNPAI